MTRTQEYLNTQLEKRYYLTYPVWSHPTSEKTKIQNVTGISFSEFLHISPIQGSKWVPLDLLWYYAHSLKRNETYFISKSYSKYQRKYKSFIPYLEIFSGSRGNVDQLYCCETSRNTYFIKKGLILDKDMNPLIRVMVEIAPSNSENIGEAVQICDSKVLIDYSVFESRDDAEKTIKGWLLPMFLGHRYKIELCNLREIDIYEHPEMPRLIKKSRELVYDVLKKNFNMLEEMFLNNFYYE